MLTHSDVTSIFSSGVHTNKCIEPGFHAQTNNSMLFLVGGFLATERFMICSLDARGVDGSSILVLLHVKGGKQGGMSTGRSVLVASYLSCFKSVRMD